MRWRVEAGLTAPVSAVVAGLAGLVEDHVATLGRGLVEGGIVVLDRSYLGQVSCGRWLT